MLKAMASRAVHRSGREKDASKIRLPPSAPYDDDNPLISVEDDLGNVVSSQGTSYSPRPHPAHPPSPKEGESGSDTLADDPSPKVTVSSEFYEDRTDKDIRLRVREYLEVLRNSPKSWRCLETCNCRIRSLLIELGLANPSDNFDSVESLNEHLFRCFGDENSDVFQRLKAASWKLDREHENAVLLQDLLKLVRRATTPLECSLTIDRLSGTGAGEASPHSICICKCYED